MIEHLRTIHSVDGNDMQEGDWFINDWDYEVQQISYFFSYRNGDAANMFVHISPHNMLKDVEDVLELFPMSTYGG